jgi:hypothetical protein
MFLGRPKFGKVYCPHGLSVRGAMSAECIAGDGKVYCPHGLSVRGAMSAECIAGVGKVYCPHGLSVRGAMSAECIAEGMPEFYLLVMKNT